MSSLPDGQFPSSRAVPFRLGQAEGLTLLLLLGLYLLLPTRNSTVDAWYYAASIRYGHELFLPHHLLYNATGYVVLKGVQLAGISTDALALMKVLNACAAAAGMLVLARVLALLGITARERAPWLLVAGTSFGLWRFAVENEAYVLPVLFSLLGSLFFVRWLRTQKLSAVLLSGFWAAIACLYHQIHFFWWLGLLLGVIWICRQPRPVLLYLLPALLVPLAYALVISGWLHQPLSPHNVLHFVFHDFYGDTVSTSVGLRNLLLTGISFVRSFGQVHGLQLALLQRSWLFALPAVGAAVLLLLAWWRSKGRIKAREQLPFRKATVLTHLLIFLLQLLWADYSVGNAEFMIMLPVLLVLVLAAQFEIRPRVLWLAGLALLVWNLSYGTGPAHLLPLQTSEPVLTLLRQQPAALFIVRDPAQVTNEWYYQTGQEELPQVVAAPGLRVLRGQPLEELQAQVAQALQQQRPVYTDCIGQPKVLNRAALLTPAADSAFFRPYRLAPADSAGTFYGKQLVHRLFER